MFLLLKSKYSGVGGMSLYKAVIFTLNISKGFSCLLEAHTQTPPPHSPNSLHQPRATSSGDTTDFAGGHRCRAPVGE